jgi:hypothetical protein
MNFHFVLFKFCGYPCHHGMARPRVADGRDGLQLEVSCEYIE